MEQPASAMNTMLPKLGRLIQRRRRHVRLSLPAVAARVGMSMGDLCSLEEGFAPWPGAERIRAITRALGCEEPGEAFEMPGLMPLHTPTANAADEWLRFHAQAHER